MHRVGRDGVPGPHQTHLPAENLGGVVVQEAVKEMTISFTPITIGEVGGNIGL